MLMRDAALKTIYENKRIELKYVLYGEQIEFIQYWNWEGLRNTQCLIVCNRTLTIHTIRHCVLLYILYNVHITYNIPIDLESFQFSFDVRSFVRLCNSNLSSFIKCFYWFHRWLVCRCNEMELIWMNGGCQLRETFTHTRTSNTNERNPKVIL